MDIYYVFLVIPALIVSLVAQAKVKSAYASQSKVTSRRIITGCYAAQCMLMHFGITDVRIVPIAGKLTDNYNPTTKVLSLSQGVYDSTSIAAIGIACHEAGHAVQHANDYAPIRFRNAFVPVCNIGSKISIPLLIIGLIAGLDFLVFAGIILFSFVTLFHLVTLPVEFDASHRAISAIEEYGFLDSEEISGAKKVLKAAAMTYVAALLTSLAQLLRLILRYGNRRK